MIFLLIGIVFGREARRHNASLETDNLYDELKVVLKPDGTKSTKWPIDLQTMFSYTSKYSESALHANAGWLTGWLTSGNAARSYEGLRAERLRVERKEFESFHVAHW